MTNNRFQETLRQLHPPVEPSPELAEKIAALAEKTDRATAPGNSKRNLSTWTVRLAVAALATTVLLIFAVGVTPQKTLARTLRTVSSNLQNAESTHFRILFFPDTPKTITLELWFQKGKWRQDSITAGTHYVQIKDGDMFWNYLPAERRASYQKTGVGFPSIQFDGEKTQQQIYNALNNPRGKNLGMETIDGRLLQKIALPGKVQKFFFSPQQQGRSVFWIDKEKMLPSRIEEQLFEEGKWVTVQRIEYDLDQPVTSSVFQIPPDTRIYDTDKLGTEVGNRFARPLAIKQFKTRTIALRDVQINADGDIFVLYTDGSTRHRDNESYGSRVEDDRGTSYSGLSGIVDPYMYCSDKASDRGIMVGKEAMRGGCAVPSVPLSGKPLPRRVSIDIHFLEWEKKKYRTRTAHFTVPVPTRRTTLLPTYGTDLTSLALMGGRQKEFLRDREMIRRSHYYNTQDWAGMIRITDREIAQEIADVNTYLDRVTAYQKMGRWAEARTELENARKADQYGTYQNQIQLAEKEQGGK